MKTEQLVIASQLLKTVDGEKMIDILLVPEGLVEARGKQFTLKQEHFAGIKERFDSLSRAIVIDYQHQTLGGSDASPDGIAPAAGWIHEIRYEKGRGIVGTVEWTAKCRKFIKDGEFRFLSPVVLMRIEKSGATPFELINAAVTNDPAIRGMERLAASRKLEKTVMPKGKKKTKKNEHPLSFVRFAFQEGEGVTPEEQAAVVEEVVEQVDEVGVALANLKAALGMGEGATPVEIINEAIVQVTAPAEEEGEGEAAPAAEVAASRRALGSICESLALKAGSTVKDITGKIDVLFASRVSKTEYEDQSKRLKVLEDERLEANATEAVDRFVASGQLNPNDDERMVWANARARGDVSEFTDFMEGSPVVVPVGKLGEAKDVKGGRNLLIASSKAEYANANLGCASWSFVNESLKEKGFDVLTKAERTKLGEEV